MPTNNISAVELFKEFISDRAAALRLRTSSYRADELQAELLAKLRRLLNNAMNGTWLLGDFLEATEILSALPLTRDDFNLATCRLENGLRFLMMGEKGAGRYELMLLTHEYELRVNGK
jgi:hypothetical protein